MSPWKTAQPDSESRSPPQKTSILFSNKCEEYVLTHAMKILQFKLDKTMKNIILNGQNT